MCAMDFFDEDLSRARKFRLEGDASPSLDSSPSDEVPGRSISELTLTRLAKHKQEIEENVLQATQELERLKKRQEELEREKKELEELRRKQDEYQRGKKELVERIEQSLVTMEKNQIQAQRMAELLAATRSSFREMLSQIQAINEEVWPEEKFGEELNKALALIEDTRMEVNKALARIEAAGGREWGSSAAPPVMSESVRVAVDDVKPFGYWLKVGAAISIPFLVGLLLLGILWAVLQHFGMF